jgi:hypothetical protein
MEEGTEGREGGYETGKLLLCLFECSSFDVDENCEKATEGSRFKRMKSRRGKIFQRMPTVTPSQLSGSHQMGKTAWEAGLNCSCINATSLGERVVDELLVLESF